MLRLPPNRAKLCAKIMKPRTAKTRSRHLDDLAARYPDVIPSIPSVAKAFELLRASFKAGGKVLLCGNGGSAADCSHIAGELMKSLAKKHPLPVADSKALAKFNSALAAKLEGGLPALSLPDQGVIQSAFANDVDADFIFAQLAYVLGKRGDVLWAISTSGNSRNCIHALQVARARGIKTVGLLGRDGGEMKSLCDVAILAPGRNTQEIQERHLPIYHALCLMLEEAFF